MIASVFQRTGATLRERWLVIAGAVLVSSVLTVVLAMLLLFPAMRAVAPSTEATGISSTTTPVPLTPVAGTTAVAPATSPPFGLEASKTAAPKPGMGAVTKLLLAFALLGVVSIATATTGVFAAAGAGVRESMRLGATTTPMALVQTVRVSWPAIASGALGVIAGILLGGGTGILLGATGALAAAVLGMRSFGTTMLAIGAIAHGDRSWTPEAALAAADGRRWSVSGTGLVGTVVATALSIVPLAGPIFAAAFTSAMWGEYGNPVTDPTLGEPVVPADPVVLVEVPAPPSAPPSAVPVAGPTWTGIASATASSGMWIGLATPARVTLQVQWVAGSAPALHVADQAGTWTTPGPQPTASGDATTVDLPAGWSWIALVPRDGGEQQLWLASALPAGAALQAGTAAAAA